MPTPRRVAPPLWPEGNLISFPARGKFSSSGPRKIVRFCGWFHGGVPRSGEVVFLYIYQHYALSRPPRPSGHPSTGGELSAFFTLVILGLDPRIQVIGVVRHRRTFSLHSALYTLLPEKPTPRHYVPPLWPEGNFNRSLRIAL